MDLSTIARHGVVSSRQLADQGLDPGAIRSLVRAGALQRLIRGWYAVCPPDAHRPPWEGEDSFETARLQHRLRTAALLLSFEGRVVASHQSALVLHGGRLWRSDLDTVHLSRAKGDHTRHRPGAVIHPAVPLPPVSTRDGLTTVPVAMAVVQTGLPGAAGGNPDPLASLIAADGALHDELITEDQLERALALHGGHPGIQQVRRHLHHADGRHESVGETRLAHVMRALGHQFTPQVWVTDGAQRWRVDFMLDDEPVIVEFDGLKKYAGGLAAPSPGQLRDALAQEKWREDRLRDQQHQVVRFVWSELDDWGLVDRRIDAAVARARLGRSA